MYSARRSRIALIVSILSIVFVTTGNIVVYVVSERADAAANRERYERSLVVNRVLSRQCHDLNNLKGALTATLLDARRRSIATMPPHSLRLRRALDYFNHALRGFKQSKCRPLPWTKKH